MLYDNRLRWISLIRDTQAALLILTGSLSKHWSRLLGICAVLCIVYRIETCVSLAMKCGTARRSLHGDVRTMDKETKTFHSVFGLQANLEEIVPWISKHIFLSRLTSWNSGTSAPEFTIIETNFIRRKKHLFFQVISKHHVPPRIHGRKSPIYCRELKNIDLLVT